MYDIVQSCISPPNSRTHTSSIETRPTFWTLSCRFFYLQPVANTREYGRESTPCCLCAGARPLADDNFPAEGKSWESEENNEMFCLQFMAVRPGDHREQKLTFFCEIEVNLIMLILFSASGLFFWGFLGVCGQVCWRTKRWVSCMIFCQLFLKQS